MGEWRMTDLSLLTCSGLTRASMAEASPNEGSTEQIAGLTPGNDLRLGSC
jgi:hypothetical protein